MHILYVYIFSFWIRDIGVLFARSKKGAIPKN